MSASDDAKKETKHALKQFALADATYTEIFSNWKQYLLTGEPEYLNKATQLTQELEGILQPASKRSLKTTVLGLYHSAGSGFMVPPKEGSQAAMGILPDMPLYGYTKLSPLTAKFSADTFSFLHDQRRALREAALSHPVTSIKSLSELVSRAYIPIPDPILGMPVVGPIPLNDEVSSLFLSLVKGPLLHDQLPELNRFAKEGGDEGYSFRDARIWVVAQMTGVWQSFKPSPPLPGNAPKNLEDSLRGYYADTLFSSLTGIASLLSGIELTEQSEKLRMFSKHVAARLQIEQGPQGNAGRYFDAALRNFIDEVSDIDATWTAAQRLAAPPGLSLKMDALWDITRRIDFSHVARRPYCIFEEDSSHITENWLLDCTPEERIRYQIAMTLTRLALTAYYDQRTSEAIDLAESLERVREQRNPNGIKQWQDYSTKFEITLNVMPWIRKVRQAYLALLYASKAVRDQEISGIDLSASIRSRVNEEASNYLKRSAEGLKAVLQFTDARRDAEAAGGIPIVNGLLQAAQAQAAAGNINFQNMRSKGEQMRTHYV